MQKEVYIIAGVFGGITVLLLLMIIGLAWTVARLNHEVKTSKTTSQPPINKNTVAAPVMNPTRQENYPRRQQEHNHRPENNPRQGEYNTRQGEYNTRQGEYDDNMSYPHTNQEYTRGEDRTDRHSQYSWDPLPRRGEENRLPRLSYGHGRR